MGRTKLLIIGVALITVAVVGGGFLTQMLGVGGLSVVEEAETFAQAKELLEESKPEEALALISKYEKKIAKSSENTHDWLGLFIEANRQAQNIAKLAILYRHFPDAFANNEEAALMVGNLYLAARSPQDVARIRVMWKGKETLAAKWFNLDLDTMVLEGQRQEALELALKTKFEGTDDVGRLLRIALLYISKDAKKAWEALTEAYKIAPKDAGVRSFRAKLLEALGETELAKVEFIEAARTDPRNLYLRDQLAEFYRRQGNFTEALRVWAYSLQQPSLDLIWTKALFWQSVTRPLDVSLFEENTPPEGDLAPLVEYLMNLPDGVYWDQAAFDRLANSGKFLQRQQVTFWLRLLQTLKDNKEQEALSLLEFNRFTPLSWNHDLEIGLKRILIYRMTGKFALKADDLVSQLEIQKKLGTSKRKDRHPLFSELDEVVQARKDNPSAPVPPKLHHLMMSDEAFAAAFLAAGWVEAGLQLHTMSLIPSTFPDWVSFAIAQGLRYNRGAIPALEFVTKQPLTPGIELITAELLIASGSEAAGLQKLEQLAHLKNHTGEKAAWKLALVFITKEKYDKAKQIVHLQPLFVSTVQGKELLARIAYLQGDIDGAARIYSSIERESTEAKSFFARQAFQDKNWQRARELTEELLKRYPNSLPLRHNLQKIIQIQEQEKQAQNVP